MENGDIEETLTGKLKMKEEKSLLYPGHVLSKQGGNMENINHKKNKAIGTEKNILRLIQNMGPYTFEGDVLQLIKKKLY